MKKTLKVIAISLVLIMAFVLSVSAATYNQVELTMGMMYVSGAANSFYSAQAKYFGQVLNDSSYPCQVYLFGKTTSGNTGISPRIVQIYETSPKTGPFAASTYGVTSWYAYAQPSGSPTGYGGHCYATAESV